MGKKLLLLFIVLFSFFYGTSIQAQDSLKTQLPHERPVEMSRPMQAALLSAVLPGAGQAYNKKYWKVPIVYAGVAGFGFAIVNNHKTYVAYRNALIINTDNDPSTVNQFPGISNDGLKRVRDAFRRYRDLSIILSIVFYGLNIADAVVDAHLADFDVSPDLSARLSPVLIPVPGQNRVVAGMALAVSF